jgi:hypothetical protein
MSTWMKFGSSANSMSLDNMGFGAIYSRMARYLTYDEKKAAEAAFRGLPCDPTWSDAARAVYDGITKALHVQLPIESPDETDEQMEFGMEAVVDSTGTIFKKTWDAERGHETKVQTSILNREDAIQSGILIDVTPLAQELGLNLPVGISKPLWEIGITASHKLQHDQYSERVRDVLMALRLHLETTEVTSPWIKFPALLSFPPDVAPQVCSLYAVAHKDPSAPYSLTLLLPHEMSAINPSEQSS